MLADTVDSLLLSCHSLVCNSCERYDRLSSLMCLVSLTVFIECSVAGALASLCVACDCDNISRPG